MARPVTPLTDSKCEAAKAKDKPYKLSDGGGLYLLVRPSGGKVWRIKYNRPSGQESTLTIGEYGRTGIGLHRALIPPSTRGSSKRGRRTPPPSKL